MSTPSPDDRDDAAGLATPTVAEPADRVQLPWEPVGSEDEGAGRHAATPAAFAQEPPDDDGDGQSHVVEPQAAAGAGGEALDAETGSAGVAPNEDLEVDDSAPVAEADDDDASDDVVEGGEDDAPESVAYASPVPAEAFVDSVGAPVSGGLWTIPMLCAGIALIACCVLIPQADRNRRLVYERERLKTDLESIQKQVAVNEEFLREVGGNANLAERLAQRQMKIIREGTRVLDLKQDRDGGEMSPFQLVNVAPPPPPPPYQPVGGAFAQLCYSPRPRLYLTGVGLTLVAAGLVLGSNSKP